MAHRVTPIPLVAYPSPELLRHQGDRARSAERLALELTDVCAHADQHLQFAVKARQDQQIAWLALCDRGWPVDTDAECANLTHITRWREAWAELLALPVKVWKPHHMLRMKQVRKRLTDAEGALRTSLPVGIWSIVDPLDDTGRATLAYILEALDTWHDASTRTAAATRIKEALIQRFGDFARQAASLSIRPPRAPLDLDGWRAVAVDARLVAEELRRKSDEVPSSVIA